MKQLSMFIFLAVLGSTVWGQGRQNYVYDFAEIAVYEMEKSGIPASITLAQGILESGNGNSELARKSNNHFGIKCHKGWNGPSVRYDDDAKNECFRKYNDPAQSYRDHSVFLTTRGRYSSLFELSKFDYKGWAHGLKRAGYATSPTYAQKLIRIIEEERLYDYDYMTVKEVQPYVLALKEGRTPKPVSTSKAGKKVSKNPSKPPRAKTPKILSTTSGAADQLKRGVFYQNNIQAVWALSGDSPSNLASRYGLSEKRLRKYNEWDQYLSEFKAGMKVYLQPKRAKSQDKASLYHTVKYGETMYMIAQFYGVKTDKLYKLNRFAAPMQPEEGQVIHLRKKRKTPPRTHSYVLEKTATQPVVRQNPSKQPPAQKDTTKTPAQAQQPEPPKTKMDSFKQGLPVQTKEMTNVETSSPPPPPKTNPPASPTKEVSNPPSPPIQDGRAVIYQPTPEVNKRPVDVYVPEANRPKTTPSNPKEVSQEPVNVPSTSTSVQRHTVSKGDTLWGISRKYNVSVAELKEWNNLTDNNIKIGQSLKVSKGN